ncbi:uncharacterized protein LOC110652215 [Hevea brasiliensis]|uniref:uncharacterized protein LOC110652215 n=1 Tax=Hevea brasiliensis TaxID=3981 RepID=UPI0025EA6A5B|nr:uncharacterized protein LOC110652215 [Hevea brasiliensis]
MDVMEAVPFFGTSIEMQWKILWEAANIPKVKVAKLDRSKVSKEQSVYMPQIPEIAKCPENLKPLKQWEDAFLADFSELRTLPEHFTQLAESVILEKFNNLRTDEVHSNKVLDVSCLSNAVDPLSVGNAEDSKILAYSQDNSPKSSISDSSCNCPTLSAILAMDSVARASVLRKRINSVETMSMLSKNDCVWLFALCAAVDTPLDADTSAALRSLLHKCASLRAAKSELDDEVVMLNILATISGRYFGQSEN